MTRLAPLVLFALLVGACRPETDPIGSPGGSVAGTETKHDGSASKSPSDATSGANSGVAKSLIAVTTTSASEAQPCEHMCGSLGDCLLADDAYTNVAASGLELQCLDMCVHAPDTDPVKTEFLACDSLTECGQLQACAERNWTALASVRSGQGPAISGVIASNLDPCKNACRWVLACLVTGQPPGAAQLDEYIQREIDNCFGRCENGEVNGADLEQWIRMAECLPDHCSSVDDAYYCIYQMNP
jgi:hypothetical protein